ncbi:MAG: DUF4286 family protein [Dysgonomonas sp.]
MYIYNTTYHIHDEVIGDSLVFFKRVYIPQALVSGVLTEPRFAFIHHQNQEPGASYSLQFKVESVDALNDWLHKDGAILQRKMVEIFSDKIAGFNTLLEEIDIEL